MSDNEVSPLPANISSNDASRTTVRVRHDDPELLATIQPSSGEQLQERDDEPIEEREDSFASDEPIANYVNRIRSRARNQADGAFPTTIPRFSPVKYSSRRSSSKGKAKIPDDSSLSEPLDLIQKFYTPATMHELVANTNKNAAIVNTDGESRRAWRDVNAADLLQFVE